MLFKNSQKQKENFIGFKLHAFITDSFNKYAEVTHAAVKETVEKYRAENIELSDAELDDIGNTLVGSTRFDIAEGVGNFIENTYRGKGQVYINLLTELMTDNDSDDYALDKAEIIEHGPDAAAMLVCAINAIFPEQPFRATMGQDTPFYDTMLKLIFVLWRDEALSYESAYKGLIEEGLIDKYPTYVGKFITGKKKYGNYV